MYLERRLFHQGIYKNSFNYFKTVLLRTNMKLGKYILSLGWLVNVTSMMAMYQPVPTPIIIGNKQIEFKVNPVYGLNTEFSDFSPVLLNSEFIFVSDREYDYRNIGEDNWKANKHINIFKSQIKSNSADSIVFAKAKLYDRKFMDEDHSGPICFSKDGNTAIFTKISYRDARKSGFGEKQGLFAKTSIKPQLYQAEFKDGKWSDIEKLSFVKVNKTYGHPALSSDGNVLYFVSDEFGGKGGKDLFKVEMTTNGWGEPQALNALNTSGDELFPTILGNELYFSSNGREGEGGLDLFVSTLKDGRWSTPINLGNTINTAADEFGMVFNPDKMSGYFSSNRENGTGSDDIYYFSKTETITIEENSIAGKFTYKHLKDKNPQGLDVMLVDDQGNLISTTKTGEDGSFKFMNLKSDERYTIKLSEESDDLELTLFGKDADAFLLANRDGEFVYRKLSDDNAGTLSLMSEEDVDPITKKGQISGQFVFRKLNNSAGGLEVLLVDDEGNIVRRTVTDANGNFNFKELPMDENYRIKTVQISDDLELYIYNGRDAITATLASDENGMFVYRKLDDDFANSLAKLQLEEEELEFEAKKMMLSGEFKYRDLNESMQVVDYEIFDPEMNLLVKSQTDETSFFRHFSLPDVNKLIFKIDPNKFKEDVDLFVLDRNREVVIQLDKDDKGYFIYQKLKDGDNGVMTEEELLATLKNESGIAGQFLYKKLKSEDQFLEYEIYDEDGNLVKRGKTDRFGVFSEPDLPKDGKFKFKLLNADETARLRIYREEDGKLIMLDKESDGFFVFEKLTSGDVALNTGTEENNDMLIRFNQGKLASNLFYAHNIYKLSAENKSKIEEIVKFMETNKDAKIVVNSYASLIGSNEYNKQLSKRRMIEVVDYLKEAGVSEDRFSGQFFGEDNPLVDCTKQKCSDSDIRQNRRTEIRIVK